MGKIEPEALRHYVFPFLGARRPDVLVHSQLGEDSAVIDFGDEVCVVSTDPITGAARNVGWIGVHVSCNDVASNGASPIGIQVMLLLPAGSSDEELERIMRQIDGAAKELGIEVLGGHTERTSNVSSPVLSVTAIGRAKRDRYVTSGGASPGDYIMMTKAAGIEGTAVMAHDFETQLREVFGRQLVENAMGFIRDLSVVKDGIAAAAAGATALHDATEGGVLGAIWEMSEASGAGVEVWKDSIPVREETRLICAHFGLDPLRLLSSGSMIIACRDPETMKLRLREEGVDAHLIGRFLRPEEGRHVIDGVYEDSKPSRRSPLTAVEVDELWRLLESS